MRDYVNCGLCGTNLDSDFTTMRITREEGIMFFCNEKHAEEYNKKI